MKADKEGAAIQVKRDRRGKVFPMTRERQTAAKFPNPIQYKGLGDFSDAQRGLDNPGMGFA